MTFSLNKHMLTACAAAAVALFAQTQAQAVELNFGVISVDSSNALRSAWEPVMNDWSACTGYTIKPFFATDYAGVIEGMRFNKVQLGWFGNLSATEAVDRSNGEVFAKTIRMDGSEGYNSLLVTHKDSPYNNLSDFLKHTKEINFGIGDPNSTSGFLVPSYYVFAKNNVNPKTDFKSIRSANHATNLMAASLKQVDVATNNTEDWERAEKARPEVIKELKIIWKSPLIPADPFVYRTDLPAEQKAKIKSCMTGYTSGPNAADHKEKLAKIVSSGIVPSTNDQLKPIRQIALFTEMTKLENDANMDASEKQKKIAAIKEKLAVLEK
jgi:phosphonate transport system substrate-binding protein